MVFSSYPFLFGFLPLTLIGFYLIRRRGALQTSVSFLLAASVVFYACWSVWHLALLAFSITVNFHLGRFIGKHALTTVRRRTMIAGVVFNLGLIFIFKYLDFAGANAAALIGADWRLLDILLPLGISFFTFQQIAYLVDCYKSQSHEANFRQYALFVSFFPQLIAGPIVHHAHTRPQFAAIAHHPINLNGVAYGVIIFAMGLFKKTVIGDPIGRAIDPVYAAAAAGDVMTAGMSALAAIGYTLQIYFDFSGYCDMAIGIGLMLGIRLPVNFNSPYKAASIIEFWRRWHITLSNFLRDYVYIPLGGSRTGQVLRLRNIFLTMLIGGVWHGAAWTFIIWGALHAAAITLNHAARLWLPQLDALNGVLARIAKRLALIGFVTIAWVFFRADTLPAALSILQGFGVPGGVDIHITLLAHLVGAATLALLAPNSLEIVGYNADSAKPLAPPRTPSVMRLTPLAAVSTAIMLTCAIAVAWRPAAFIYFNF